MGCDVIGELQRDKAAAVEQRSSGEARAEEPAVMGGSEAAQEKP
jgi:hypothetical protein